MPIHCKLKETRPPAVHAKKKKKVDRVNRETNTRARVRKQERQYLFAYCHIITAWSSKLIQTTSQEFRKYNTVCACVRACERTRVFLLTDFIMR